MSSRWVLYCNTEDTIKYVYSDTRPTSCPDDNTDPSILDEYGNMLHHVVDSTNAYIEDTMLFTTKNIINNDTFAMFDQYGNIVHRFDTTNGYVLTKPMHVIQDNASGVTINSSGVLLQGDAMRWRSEFMPSLSLSSSNVSVVTSPASITFPVGAECYFIMHLPPSYAENTNILVALNWTRKLGPSETETTYTGHIGWSLGLHWTNIGDPYPPLLTVNASEDTTGKSGNLNRSILSTVYGNSKKQRSVVSGYIKRDSVLNESTPQILDAADVCLVSVEILYQVSELD